MRRWLAALLVLCPVACSQPDQNQQQDREKPRPVIARGPISPPVLENREEVVRYRDLAARTLLPPGDSLTVKVFARIDEQGIPHQPEVRQNVDESIIGAAISVVQTMHFTPAQEDGKPISVLLTIPVRFVHQPGQ